MHKRRLVCDQCADVLTSSMLPLCASINYTQGQPCGATHGTANTDNSGGGLSLLLKCQEQQDSSSGSIRCIGPLDDDVRSSITSTAATAADGSVYGDDDDDSNTEASDSPLLLLSLAYSYCYCYYHCLQLVLLLSSLLLLLLEVCRCYRAATIASTAAARSLLLQGLLGAAPATNSTTAIIAIAL
jgi:hypothetical protein